MKQGIWEIVVTSNSIGKTPEPACSNTAASQKSPASKRHPPNRPQGGDKKMHIDIECNHHVVAIGMQTKGVVEGHIQKS